MNNRQLWFNSDSKELKKYVYDNFDKDVVCKKIIKICKKVIQELYDMMESSPWFREQMNDPDSFISKYVEIGI